MTYIYSKLSTVLTLPLLNKQKRHENNISCNASLTRTLQNPSHHPVRSNRHHLQQPHKEPTPQPWSYCYMIPQNHPCTRLSSWLPEKTPFLLSPFLPQLLISTSSFIHLNISMQWIPRWSWPQFLIACLKLVAIKG